jgi:hypothetical protein
MPSRIWILRAFLRHGEALSQGLCSAKTDLCYLISIIRVRRWLSFAPAYGPSDSTMKAKSKAKAKSKHKTRTKPKTSRTTRASAATRLTSITTPNLSPDFKTCEEIEVGDIGGFGITSEERMERETHCTQRATQFCTSCAKNLCNTHYDLLHKDHDNPIDHDSGPSPVQM